MSSSEVQQSTSNLAESQSQNLSSAGNEKQTPKMALYFVIAGSCLSLATGNRHVTIEPWATFFSAGGIVFYMVKKKHLAEQNTVVPMMKVSTLPKSLMESDSVSDENEYLSY